MSDLYRFLERRKGTKKLSSETEDRDIEKVVSDDAEVTFAKVSDFEKEKQFNRHVNEQTLSLANSISKAVTKLSNSKEERVRYVRDIFEKVVKEISIEDKLQEELFSEFYDSTKPLVAMSPLPTTAPKLWTERDKRSKQTPVDFIKRTYEIWLDRGLVSRPYLRRVDPPLYMALHHWLKTNPLPDDMNLPTKAELSERDLKRAGPEGIRAARRLVGLAYKP